MVASDYPISFPFGATSAPYSPAHPHRGDDRACPSGTPVVINGITIGLTGATGKVTGPHLHIQEWHDNYLDIRKPQNAFKGGTVVNIDPNGTQGDGSFGKFIDVRADDGWTDSYCHLSQINVSVGQVLQGEDMGPLVTSTDQARKIYNEYAIDIAGNDPALVSAVNKPELELRRGIAGQVNNNVNNPETGYKAQIADLQAQVDAGSGEYVKTDVYIKKK